MRNLNTEELKLVYGGGASQPSCNANGSKHGSKVSKHGSKGSKHGSKHASNGSKHGSKG
jgi:hypothetical protein